MSTSLAGACVPFSSRLNLLHGRIVEQPGTAGRTLEVA